MKSKQLSNRGPSSKVVETASNQTLVVHDDPLQSCVLDKSDWEHAFDLLEHVDRCHGAVLHVPGIGSALSHNEKVGIHCADPAYRLISDLLYYAKARCQAEVDKKGGFNRPILGHR
ncbi:MAG: hypothetical protein ACR2HH_15885 [Chthoniobacterales bacterium]